MPELIETKPGQTEIEVFNARINELVQTQQRTNDLLMKVLNNNIRHFNSLIGTQDTNTAKQISIFNAQREDSIVLREAVDNNAAWLSNVHDRALQTNNLLDKILNKNINVVVSSDILLQKILDVLRLTLDDGEYENITGTATTTAEIYDFTKISPYHPVKGYIIKNDGTVTISIAINDSSKFYDVRSKESDIITINSPSINKIFVRTASGTADFRLRILW